MGHPDGQGLPLPEPQDVRGTGRGEEGGAVEQPGGAPDLPGGNPWSDPVWVFCRDGRYRPIPRVPEPLFCEVAPGLAADLGLVRHGDTQVYSPFVEGTPNRKARLKGYANSLCAQAAAAFVRAYMGIQAHS